MFNNKYQNRYLNLSMKTPNEENTIIFYMTGLKLKELISKRGDYVIFFVALISTNKRTSKYF